MPSGQALFEQVGRMIQIVGSDFANAVGITPANVAVLKNGRARAIRFTTLDSICRVLDCQPGDILRWLADPP